MNQKSLTTSGRRVHARSRTIPRLRLHVTTVCVLLIALLIGGCSASVQAPTSATSAAPAVLTVAAHDSFSVSEDVIKAFESEHNVRVQFLSLGDAGEALNKLILSKDAPLADVFYGVDNTLLGRALKAGIFTPYASPSLATVPESLRLDTTNALLPVDAGYITLNADKAWFADHNLPLPTSIEQLADPAYKDLLVVEDPVTSSPGLAFLLATIAHFGPDGWVNFWQSLRENGVLVADGWTQAYYDHFTVGSGGTGNRPLVVSYTSSPPADVIYATDGRTEPASVNVDLDGALFRQVEFAGILKGARQPELAQAFMDFVLSKPFQEDVPLQMFVYPVQPDTELPTLFTQFAAPPGDFAQLSAEEIDAGRDAWLQQWSDVMLK